MPDALPEQDQKALQFIHAHIARHGYGPSIREVGEHLGMPSPNNAKRVVDRLGAGGLLRLNRPVGGRPRPMQVVRTDAQRDEDMTLPLVGKVSCGSPVELLDETGDRFDFKTFTRGDGLVVFEATGDSMIEAHIQPGDALVVKPCEDPVRGQTVVALLDRSMVCKKFVPLGDGRVRLDPCNGAMKPIIVEPPTQFRVLGVLHSVHRKM